LLADPRMLGIAGGGIAVVLLLILLLVRRSSRRKSEEQAAKAKQHVAPVPEPETESEPTAESEAGAGADEIAEAAEEAAEAEEETEKTMVLNRPPLEEADIEVEAPEPASEDTIATEAGEEDLVVDDTISEADVFLAYGLYGQAEELLQGALQEHPERNDYRVKLLETWFAAKEADKFAELAKELHERTGGKGKLWERAVVMGKELLPDDPLFAGAEVGDMSLDDIVKEKPEAADIDLSSEELGSGDEMADLDIGGIDLEAPVDSGAEEAGTQAGMETTQVLNPDLTVDEKAERETESMAMDEVEAMDFDLGDLDLGETEASQEAEGLSPEEQADTASFEVGDLGTSEEGEGKDETVLDMDIPELEELETPPETEQMDISDLDLEAFEEAAEGAAEEQSGEEEEFEIDDLEIDLGAESGETEVMPEEGDLMDLDEEIDLDESLEEVDVEEAISTKLDLAKAYIDMGDAEGARSTLEEVMAEGNDEQKKEAQALLDQID